MFMQAVVIEVQWDRLLVLDLETRQNFVVISPEARRFRPGEVVNIWYTDVTTASIPPQITAWSIAPASAAVPPLPPPVVRPPCPPGFCPPGIRPPGVLPPIIVPPVIRPPVIRPPVIRPPGCARRCGPPWAVRPATARGDPGDRPSRDRPGQGRSFYTPALRSA